MYNWHCRVNRITMKWEPVNLRELMCELPFHCLARSCHLEVLMVISIDSLLIKQLRKLLNVILVISLFTWQDVWRDNSILEKMSSWHLYRYVFWPISQQQCGFRSEHRLHQYYGLESEVNTGCTNVTVWSQKWTRAAPMLRSGIRSEHRLHQCHSVHSEVNTGCPNATVWIQKWIRAAPMSQCAFRS